MRISRNHWIGLALAVLTFGLAPSASAQYPGYITNSNDTGLPSYGSFISSSIDTVNLGTGGVSIRIPIFSNSGRGTTFTSVLQYESKFWTSIPTVIPNGQNVPVAHFVWSPDTSALWQVRDNVNGHLDWTETTFTCDMPPQGGEAGWEIVYMYGPATVLVRSNYVYTAPDGSKHQLPLRNNFPVLFPGFCPNLDAGTLPTNLVAHTDNDQIQIDITNDTLLDHSGIVITQPNGTKSLTTGLRDTNGNFCCIGGRPIATIDSASTQNETIYDVIDSNGGTQKVKIDYTNISYATAFPTTSYDAYHVVDQASGTSILKVVSKVTLANGLAYTFSYDPTYGEITQINLPTGGYVKYTWVTLPLADLGPTDPLSTILAQPQIDARRISQRIVSEDGTAGSEKVWTYTYPTINGGYTGVTKVTDPLGNFETHSFGSCSVSGFVSFTGQPSIDNGVSYYDPSGKLLKTVANSWACDRGALYIAYIGKNLPNANALLTEGIRNLRQTGTTTTLADTNQVSASQTDYNDCYNYTIYGQSYTDCRPNPTETREYDYGIGSPGSLKRKTDLTYLHNANSAYLNAHIWDKVSVKAVYDGSGNLAAQTNYGYDTTAVAVSPGAANHDDTNYSSSYTLRGNVTTVGRLLTSNSTWLTTTNVYNQVGNLVQTTDPGGHTYNLSYTDNYTDGTNHNSQAFLTSVTSPSTANGIPHVEGKQYYWYTGLTAAVCGQNAPTPASCSNSLIPTAGAPVSDYAKYTYDLMGRPATVTHGDGGVTTFTFQETSFPFSVSSNSTIDTQKNLVNTALIDGLGRVTQTQLNSDPDGVDKVDTTYDPAGQKATVSNPYRFSSDPTYGITTYEYDALGRTVKVIPPDGTTSSNNVTTIYSGNSVTVTDQAGKQRRSFTDALGRLIEVDEPSAPAGATNANGYTVVNGTLQIGGGTAGHGTVTISGSEQSGTGDPPCTLYDCGGNCIQWGNPPVYYDQGFVSITVNGHADTVGYGQTSTPANIASSLASAINADSSAAVTATVSGTVITLTAKVHGVSTDYSLTSTSWSTDTSGYIMYQSFAASPSGSALTGGVNDTTDTGTVWVSVGGVQVSVSYGSGSTASSVATALTAAINGSGTIQVTASASGTTINLTDKTQGSPLSLATGSSTNYSSIFSQPSFNVAVSNEFLNNYNTVPPASLLTPMVTLYTYDTLDNLTCVEQHGTATGQTGCSSSPSNDANSSWRIRRFTYDSLSRLVTAKNPESGTITYTYDADGNVLTKTDARSITTTMTYDQLHRVLTKTYSDGTPTATYIYDVAATDGPGSSANPVGRLVEVKNSNAKEVDSYDSRGHVAAQWQCTPLNCGSSWFNLAYSYNFAGGLTSESTPMGFTLTSSYDAAARLQNLTSSWSDAQHPATLLSVDATAGYTPAGALAKMTYGNGLIEISAYNNRLQPLQLRTYNPNNGNADVLNLSYGFTDSAGANNGNVVTFTSVATQIFMRSYTYDELNRLSTMSSPADASGCTGLSWTYDAWGNRLSQTVTSGTCGSPSYTLSAANRIIDTGFVHDAAGNMTHDVTHAYTFDAENHIATVDGTGATYVYDASGQRVRKTAGGVTTDYIYDASGSVVAEIQGATWTKGYAYAGGKMIAQYNGALNASGATTLFAHADHLGSTRVLTTVAASMQECDDYLPYGELLPCGGTSTTTHKFTGKERDPETASSSGGTDGLDNFGARYYSSPLGRFVSADWSAVPVAVPYVDFLDPQSLNLFTYVRDVPTVRFDLDGHASLAWERIKAVRVAWKQEQELVKKGKGTRDWTEAQKAELLEKGKVGGFEGHHINNVKDHPEMAGNPDNVAFVSRDEHLDAHAGSWGNATSGELMSRSVAVLQVADVVLSAAADAKMENLTGIKEGGFLRALAEVAGVNSTPYTDLFISDPAKAAFTLDGYSIDVIGSNGKLDVYDVKGGQFYLRGSDKPTDPNKLKGASFDIHDSSNEG